MSILWLYVIGFAVIVLLAALARWVADCYQHPWSDQDAEQLARENARPLSSAVYVPPVPDID